MPGPGTLPADLAFVIQRCDVPKAHWGAERAEDDTCPPTALFCVYTAGPGERVPPDETAACSCDTKTFSRPSRVPLPKPNEGALRRLEELWSPKVERVPPKGWLEPPMVVRARLLRDRAAPALRGEAGAAGWRPRKGSRGGED